MEWNKVPYAGSQTLSESRFKKDREFYRETQIPVLAWSALCQGAFFQEKIQPPWDLPANQDKRLAAQILAEKYDVQPFQIALAYLFHQPFPDYAVVASRSPSRVRLNLDAVGISLTQHDLDFLENGCEEGNK